MSGVRKAVTVSPYRTGTPEIPPPPDMGRLYLSEQPPQRPPPPSASLMNSGGLGRELPPPRPPPPDTDDEDDMFMHTPQPNQPIMVILYKPFKFTLGMRESMKTLKYTIYIVQILDGCAWSSPR